jgi:hypothetical protein
MPGEMLREIGTRNLVVLAALSHDDRKIQIFSPEIARRAS